MNCTALESVRLYVFRIKDYEQGIQLSPYGTFGFTTQCVPMFVQEECYEDEKCQEGSNACYQKQSPEATDTEAVR